MKPPVSNAIPGSRPDIGFGKSCIGRQSGAVLVVSLILLVVLTLLGLTSMRTTSLEEKMASNSQRSVAALQAAGSGLVDALQDDNLSTVGTMPAVTKTMGGASVTYQSTYLGSTQPPLDARSSASELVAHHYDVQATGTVGSGHTASEVDVNGGMFVLSRAAGGP